MDNTKAAPGHSAQLPESWSYQIFWFFNTKEGEEKSNSPFINLQLMDVDFFLWREVCKRKALLVGFYYYY